MTRRSRTSNSEEFLNKFSEIAHDLAPINKANSKREDIQKNCHINQTKQKILTKSNTLIFKIYWISLNEESTYHRITGVDNETSSAGPNWLFLQIPRYA